MQLKTKDYLYVLIVAAVASGATFWLLSNINNLYQENQAQVWLAQHSSAPPKTLSDGRLQVNNPKEGATVAKTFMVSGYAQGWFEGHISILVYDGNNKLLMRTYAIAGDNYDHPAAFKTTISLPETPTTASGKIEFNDYSAKDGSLRYQKVVSIKFAAVSSTTMSGWKTYKNDQYGFEIQYPKDWYVTENQNLFSIFGQNADLASINIKYYSSLSDLPLNPIINKPYADFEHYIMDQYFFKNQSLISLNYGTAESAVLAADPTIHVILIGGNQHFYELSLQSRNNQTLDQLTQIVKTFKFTK